LRSINAKKSQAKVQNLAAHKTRGFTDQKVRQDIEPRKICNWTAREIKTNNSNNLSCKRLGQGVELSKQNRFEKFNSNSKFKIKKNWH